MKYKLEIEFEDGKKEIKDGECKTLLILPFVRFEDNKSFDTRMELMAYDIHPDPATLFGMVFINIAQLLLSKTGCSIESLKILLESFFNSPDKDKNILFQDMQEIHKNKIIH